MSDSIVYRKDVVEALYQALRTQLQGTFTDSMSLAISMAKALPSAEQKTGKWIHDGCDHPHGVDWMHCSECGKRDVFCPNTMTNYCPNCGSYNGGEQDETD